MNWGQFENYVSRMCLASAVVGRWSLTQQMTGSNSFTVVTNNLFIGFSEFNESIK